MNKFSSLERFLSTSSLVTYLITLVCNSASEPHDEVLQDLGEFFFPLSHRCDGNK